MAHRCRGLHLPQQTVAFSRRFRCCPEYPSYRSPCHAYLAQKPNSACFPKDDGVDTVTRTLHFWGQCRSLVQGDFFGHNEGSPRDTFTVSIRLCQTTPLIRGNGVYVSNLFRGCGRIYARSKITHKALEFGDGTSGCRAVSGLAKIGDDSSKITIDYTIFDANFQNMSRLRFTGIRKRI